MAFGDSRIFTSGRFATEFDFHLPGETRRVRGIFDNAFFDRSLGENSLETTMPRISAVPMSAISGVPSETLVRNLQTGEWFSVVQIQPDGTGMAAIVLAHDSPPEDPEDDDPEGDD